MQATLQQKAQVLQALYSYCEGQLNGAQTSAASAATDGDDEGFESCEGHVSDAQDVLQVAVAFAQHGDLQQMLHAVDLHDTMVREDVYACFEDYEELFAVLLTLDNFYNN